MVRYPFDVGSQYTRKDIYRIVGMPAETRGGNWETGYSRLGDDFFLFVNLGVPGRTGHQYRNRIDGHLLYWEAKNRTRIGQTQIQRLLHPSGIVYIFCRTNNNNPFTFYGAGFPVSCTDTTPVGIVWRLDPP